MTVEVQDDGCDATLGTIPNELGNPSILPALSLSQVRLKRPADTFADELNVVQIYARVALSSVALVLLCAGVPPTRAGDASTSGASGQAAFNNNCRTCHSTKEGDNRLGPSLSNIVGAKAAARSGYANYSQAMKTAGITWDEQTLDRFIANPESVVPNNNMKPFKGVPDAAARKAIIEYLKAAAD